MKKHDSGLRGDTRAESLEEGREVAQGMAAALHDGSGNDQSAPASPKQLIPRVRNDHLTAMGVNREKAKTEKKLERGKEAGGKNGASQNRVGKSFKEKRKGKERKACCRTISSCQTNYGETCEFKFAERSCFSKEAGSIL